MKFPRSDLLAKDFRALIGQTPISSFFSCSIKKFFSYSRLKTFFTGLNALKMVVFVLRIAEVGAMSNNIDA